MEEYPHKQNMRSWLWTEMGEESKYQKQLQEPTVTYTINE